MNSDRLLQIIAARRIGEDLERTRVAVVDHQVVGTNDDFELQSLGQVKRSGIAVAGQVQLQDIRLGKHRGENQEEHQDHHHVDHRHDVQIIAPLVIAGVIASDEARGF